MHRTTLTALTLAASLSAQSFTYTDFSNIASLNLLGNAAQSDIPALNGFRFARSLTDIASRWAD